MTLDEIIADTTKYADTMEIAIGDTKVPLGTLRATQKAVAEQRQALEKERETVKDLSTKAAEIYNQLQTQLDERSKQAAVTPPAAGDDGWDSDPYYAPVRKRFSEKIDPIAKTIGELQAAQKQLMDSVARAATIWAEDRWEREYRDLKPRLEKSKKDKEWTYEKVRDYAAQNKLFDRHGFPSVEKAILELTKEDELAIQVKEAYEKGLREGTTKGRMNVMPRPTSAAGVKKATETAAVAEKGLEGLGDDVAQDPEMMEMLAEIGAINPSDILQ